MKKIILFILAFGLVSCGPSAAPAKKKITQSQKAAEAAESISFTENAEIENIKKRLELTSDPGLTGFVLLMNEMGQPVMYTGVTGKITSGGKRLTQGQRIWERYDKSEVLKTPSDEGTWGNSNPYIYFWTTNGQYIQWNGKYLYSDKPFRLKVEPIVMSIKESTNYIDPPHPQGDAP